MHPTTPPHSPRFERSLRFVLLKEGGFNDIAADRGGATNLGISLRFARSLGRALDLDHDGDVDADDIELLTPERAAGIYLVNFWGPARCDALPAPLDLIHFDAAVNCGVGGAALMLQRAVGAEPDGRIGPRTLAALARKPVGAAAREMLARRMLHHAQLSRDQVQTFGLGWMRRLSALGFEAATELTTNHPELRSAAR